MSADVRSVYVSTIPHGQQRYDTIGDWFYYPPLTLEGERHNRGVIEILTSELGDWRMSMCCAVHELVETLLCVNDGVDEKYISAFDVAYEQRRQMVLAGHWPPPDNRGDALYMLGCDCVPTEDSEPGEDRHAPYRKQHAFADGIERLLANQLGVVWDEYAEKVTSLDYEKEKAAYAEDQKAKTAQAPEAATSG